MERLKCRFHILEKFLQWKCVRVSLTIYTYNSPLWRFSTDSSSLLLVSCSFTTFNHWVLSFSLHLLVSWIFTPAYSLEIYEAVRPGDNGIYLVLELTLCAWLAKVQESSRQWEKFLCTYLLDPREISYSYFLLK